MGSCSCCEECVCDEKCENAKPIKCAKISGENFGFTEDIIFNLFYREDGENKVPEKFSCNLFSDLVCRLKEPIEKKRDTFMSEWQNILSPRQDLCPACEGILISSVLPFWQQILGFINTNIDYRRKSLQIIVKWNYYIFYISLTSQELIECGKIQFRLDVFVDRFSMTTTKVFVISNYRIVTQECQEYLCAGPRFFSYWPAIDQQVDSLPNCDFSELFTRRTPVTTIGNWIGPQDFGNITTLEVPYPFGYLSCKLECIQDTWPEYPTEESYSVYIGSFLPIVVPQAFCADPYASPQRRCEARDRVSDVAAALLCGPLCHDDDPDNWIARQGAIPFDKSLICHFSDPIDRFYIPNSSYISNMEHSGCNVVGSNLLSRLTYESDPVDCNEILDEIILNLKSNKLMEVVDGPDGFPIIQPLQDFPQPDSITLSFDCVNTASDPSNPGDLL
jgi:hypothetical protein